MDGGLAVLVEAFRRGGRTIWEPPDRPRLEVPADLRAPLLADRRTVRLVLARAAAFRVHLRTPGPAPILLFHDAPDRRVGCISCGMDATTVRCAVCSLALWIALGRRPPRDLLGA
jgi:hypothetical protein